MEDPSSLSAISRVIQLTQPETQATMARVNVKFIGSIKNFTREPRTTLNVPAGSNLGYLLKILCEKYGLEFKNSLFAHMGYINPGLIVLVNGLEITSIGGLDTVLESGDVEIAIIPELAGG